MRRELILIAAVAVAGCTPDQAKDMAACQAEVMRFYPAYIASKLEDPGTRYIIGCMAARGYEFEVTSADCNSRYPLPTQAACYAPRNWIAGAFDRFRRKAQSE